MNNSEFSILVVGLGLIGGSVAKALRGFKSCTIYGVDTDEAVIKQAESDYVIKKGYTSILNAPKCKLVIICVKPAATLSILKNAKFDDDVLVTDVCGVKQYLQSAGLSRNFRYIGGHPMAGKEVGGYENSDPELFKNASYLLTPTENSLPEDIELLKNMAAHMGFRKTVITSSSEHDQMIAYTSQLMHVVAAALCDNHLLDKAEGFSAGSLRDCTRVAKMDSKMWTELFIANKEALSDCIDSFINSINAVKTALLNNNAESLHSFLENSSDRKRRYLNEDTSR